MELTEEEWRERLSEKAYAVCRLKGTEPPFSGSYWDCWEPGLYVCAACGEPLFSSESKFDAGSGWPSFHDPVSEEAVYEKADMEALCSRCDSHLGHHFPSGYCINSLALELVSNESEN